MTQSEELLVLERNVFRFDPDVVVIVFVPQNDIGDLNIETSVNPQRPFFRADVDGGLIVADVDGGLIVDTGFAKTPAYRKRCAVNWIKQRSALTSLLIERYNAFRLSRRHAAIQAQGNRQGVPRHLSLWTDNPD